MSAPSETATTGFPNGILLTNEFASVRLSVDLRGHTPRLLVEDAETGDRVLLDPLELASFTRVDDLDRTGWLRVGPYRADATT